MSHSSDESGEDSTDFQFKPIVSLPLIEVKTLEENEACIFKCRAKLYRFDSKSEVPEWKERGTGELKILKDPKTHHCRILMRRDKTLKICANHYIIPCMVLKLGFGSDRTFVWKAPNDFSGDHVTAETLGARFATVEIANDFKDTFETCRSKYGQSETPSEDKTNEKESSQTKSDADTKVPGSSSDLSEDLSNMKIDSKTSTDATG